MFNNLIYAVGTQIPQKIRDYIAINNEKREKIYIVGNGWASYYFTKYLDKSKFIPIIIAPNSKVLNTPKLVSRITDSNSNVEFENLYAEKILDIVEDIDTNNKTLITKSGKEIFYSKVVFAIGAEPNDFGIPGVNEQTYKLKTIADADLLRKKIDLLHTDSKIYIVGSGVTGIELATNLTKINNICDYKSINIKILDGLNEILVGYNFETKQKIYNEICSSYPNIEIFLNSLVKSIVLNEDKSIKLNYYNKTNNKNESFFLNTNPKYESDIIIWTGGVRFNGYERTKLFSTLNKLVSIKIKPRGIDVKENFSLNLQLEGPDTIYCLGDMVSNAGPPTAQNAKNQGIWLAKYFNSDFNSEFAKSNPYAVSSDGKLVHLSDKVYLESEYYSGFIFKFVDKIIELLN
jgi:NADH dehydrogenase FAD-containing subunit